MWITFDLLHIRTAEIIFMKPLAAEVGGHCGPRKSQQNRILLMLFLPEISPLWPHNFHRHCTKVLIRSSQYFSWYRAFHKFMERGRGEIPLTSCPCDTHDRGRGSRKSQFLLCIIHEGQDETRQSIPYVRDRAWRMAEIYIYGNLSGEIRPTYKCL